MQVESLANPELVDRIHYGLTSPRILCECPDDHSKIEIEIGTNEPLDPEYAVVTWTQSDTATFYCIEPWMGPPNSPETKIGLHTVSPGETEAFSVTVRVWSLVCSLIGKPYTKATGSATLPQSIPILPTVTPRNETG